MYFANTAKSAFNSVGALSTICLIIASLRFAPAARLGAVGAAPVGGAFGGAAGGPDIAAIDFQLPQSASLNAAGESAAPAAAPAAAPVPLFVAAVAAAVVAAVVALAAAVAALVAAAFGSSAFLLHAIEASRAMASTGI